MTAKRRDDLGDNLRRVGRPPQMEHAQSTAGIDRNAPAPGQRSRKSLIWFTQEVRKRDRAVPIGGAFCRPHRRRDVASKRA